jgi:hypothetical protein
MYLIVPHLLLFPFSLSPLFFPPFLLLLFSLFFFFPLSYRLSILHSLPPFLSFCRSPRSFLPFLFCSAPLSSLLSYPVSPFSFPLFRSFSLSHYLSSPSSGIEISGRAGDCVCAPYDKGQHVQEPPLHHMFKLQSRKYLAGKEPTPPPPSPMETSLRVWQPIAKFIVPNRGIKFTSYVHSSSHIIAPTFIICCCWSILRSSTSSRSLFFL